MSQPPITYQLKGHLEALVCDESRLPLSQVRLRVYAVANPSDAKLGSTESSGGFLAEEQIVNKAERFLGEMQTDDQGNFILEIRRGSYQGQPLELDVCVEEGKSRGCGPAERSGQTTLCRAEPLWLGTGELRQGAWNLCLPRFAWCRALGICQSQTLCGRVVDCHSQQPLAGVRVAAFGLDWNQDQALGQAVTDTNGRFIIHTKHSGFRRVQAAAGSNADTYDLYFRIQSQASAFPLYVDRIRWGERPQADESVRCLQVGIFVETDLARLREEGRVASFLALTGSQSVLGLRSGPKTV